MDLDFNYEIVNSFEFESRKEQLIIDLARWIAPKMNNIHGLKHDYTFWLTILDQHLNTCINKKHIFEKGGHIPRYMFTINVLGKPSFKQVFIQHVINFFRPFKEFKFGVREKIQSVLGEFKSFCAGQRAQELSADGLGEVLLDYNPILIIPNLKVKKKWKSEINKEADTFLKAVLLHIPLVYLEYFYKIYGNYELKKPHEKSFHAEHMGSIYTQVLIARYFEKNASYHIYQGGCGYGELNFSPRKHLYLTCSSFRTYGWKVHEKDVPFKAHRLEAFRKHFESERVKNQTTENKLKVLMVVGSTGLTQTRLKDITDVISNDINFEKYLKLTIRLRPFSSFLSTASTVKKMGISNKIYIDKGVGRPSIIKSTLEADVTVLLPVIPSTHLYECVAINQPFVGIDTAEVSPLMKPYQSYFHQIGLFHKNEVDMVNFLNSIDDIEVWWGEIICDPIFKEFRHTFCGNVGQRKI